MTTTTERLRWIMFIVNRTIVENKQDKFHKRGIVMRTDVEHVKDSCYRLVAYVRWETGVMSREYTKNLVAIGNE